MNHKRRGESSDTTRSVRAKLPSDDAGECEGAAGPLTLTAGPLTAGLLNLPNVLMWSVCRFLALDTLIRLVMTCKAVKHQVTTMNCLDRTYCIADISAHAHSSGIPLWLLPHIRSLKCDRHIGERELEYVSNAIPMLKHLQCGFMFIDEDDAWNVSSESNVMRRFPAGLQSCTLEIETYSIDGPSDFGPRINAIVACLAREAPSLTRLSLDIQTEDGSIAEPYSVDFTPITQLARLVAFSFRCSGDIEHVHVLTSSPSLRTCLQKLSPQLETLCLFGGSITKETIRVLCETIAVPSTVRSLSMRQSHIDAEDIQRIHSVFPHLTALEPRGLSTKSLNFIQSFSRCTTLRCHFTPKKSNPSASDFLHGLAAAPWLTRLDIGAYNELTAAHMGQLIGSLPHLVELKLVSCINVSGLAWIVPLAHRLRVLEVRWCTQMFLRDLVHLLGFTKFETLMFIPRENVDGFTRSVFTPPSVWIPSLVSARFSLYRWD